MMTEGASRINQAFPQKLSKLSGQLWNFSSSGKGRKVKMNNAKTILRQIEVVSYAGYPNKYCATLSRSILMIE